MAASGSSSGDPLGADAPCDAIIVGSGAAGGVAAAQLCAAGLKVLVLEAGHPGCKPLHPVTGGLTGLAHLIEAAGAEKRLPPGLARFGERGFRLLGRVRQPVQSRCFAWAMAPDALVDDRDCAYQTEEGTQFYWFRSRQPGGRMLVPGHGRQYYRLAGLARPAPGSEHPGWPLSLQDLEPWYGKVEDTLKLKGGAQATGRMESSRIAELIAPTAAEESVMQTLRTRWPEAGPFLGSYAAPFNWLEQAGNSGHLTLQTGAVARRVLKSEHGKAAGVEWYDSRRREVRTARAPIVFLCASAIESTRILLASRREDDPSPIGTGSSALGAYLMDHAVMTGTGYTQGAFGDGSDIEEPGRSIYLPPHPSIDTRMGFQVHVHSRADGSARLDIVSFAETLPEAWNRVTLHPSRKDRYGMPQAVIRFRFSEAQHRLAEQQAGIIRQIADDLGLTGFTVNTALSPGGTSIHECGTARMGSDPATSVVDPNNECWDVPGLYVTDAACFPRQHVHNPTLTIMALTARAAAHAASGRQG